MAGSFRAILRKLETVLGQRKSLVDSEQGSHIVIFMLENPKVENVLETGQSSSLGPTFINGWSHH